MCADLNDPATAAPRRARLFIALWPDAALRAALAALVHSMPWPANARPTSPDKLHLTLHFLGAVERERVPALAEGLRVRCEPFSFDLQDVELWRGGIAVLRPRVVPPALLALHAGLDEALAASGQATQRASLKAHVTLARRAQGANLPACVAPLGWTARGYALVESVPAPRSHYRIVAAYACGP